MSSRLTRREFVLGYLMLTVAGTSVTDAADTAAAASSSLKTAPGLDAWLRIARDGSVSLFTAKSEFGQGIKTALIQIVAAELDVAPARVTVVTPDTALSPIEGNTSRSHSVIESGAALRSAAAQAREFLLSLAAEAWAVPPAALTVADGVISSGGRRVTYGALIGGRRFHQDVTGLARPKMPARVGVHGRSLPRIDIPAKVTGGAAYVHDLRIAGMLHARVIRPPIDRPDIEIEEFTAADAAVMPGVVEVVRDGNFIAVLAEREEQAIAAAAVVRTHTVWRSPTLPALADLEEGLRTGAAKRSTIREDPGVSAALEAARHLVDATYFVPYHAHGSIGPACAVAQLQEDRLTVWCSTQAIFGLRTDIANVMSLPEDRVRVVHLEGAGCYGQNGADDAAMDACLLACAKPGRAIRVQWRREDEFAWEAKAPPMSMHIRAGSTDGNVAAFDYEYWTGPHVSRYGTKGTSTALGAWHTARPATPFFMQGPGSDLARVLAHAEGFYNFPNKRVIQNVTSQFVPLRCGEMRGVSGYGHYFAIQSMIDELAAAEGVDPIDYTLRFTDDRRMRSVIETLVQTAHWAKGPAPSGRGRGFSAFYYDRPMSRGACIVDVKLDRATGEVVVTKVVAVFDIGRVINPDGARNQMEGGIIQAISRTLLEEVRHDESAVTSLDWSSYPILRFDAIPEIEIVFLDQPEERSGGAGETQTPIVPGAIANAIFDAAGIRLRSIPFVAARVKVALKRGAGGQTDFHEETHE